ncbi:hypothetical protein Bca52824_064772 [Brassica carinata]|uniref:RING-type domain-containing protein n=1 Tax=Brassica carinata TaxID=52824 RepID=A0A8X7QHF2_BRACI|nr:hypothetical protein Bca52824_064772 [Brassica carinata]
MKVIIREKEEEKRSNINYLCNLSVLKTPVRAEAQAWQARASAQEAAATSLQAQLQQAVDMRGGGGVWAQDGRAEEEGLLEATVVMLPCRHLSICPECDRTALACPLCLTLRNSSVEAILC